MTTDAVIVLTTLPDHGAALSLARRAVEARLAACVQIVPGLTSVYRWKGAVDEASEVQLLMKTSAQREEALMAWVAAHHPYEVPEILVLDGRASEAYGAWLRAESESDGHRG